MKRVQALLEERQYVPSMAGILLAQNSSRIIGIIINDHEKYEGRALEDSYIASSLNYLSAEIKKSGQFMMIKKTCDVGEIIKFSSMWNMDRVVIMGFCAQDYSYLRERMRIPFVVYDGYCHDAKRICNISIDNYSGGFQVGEHFKHLGHKRALCIADNCECMDKERFEGFLAGFGDGSIFGKLGLPALGAEGAALATVVSQLVNFGVMLFLFFRQRQLFAPALKEKAGLSGFNWKQYAAMLLPLLICEVISQKIR